MEVKRQLDVLERNLNSRQYLCGDEYNIADIANYAWYGALVLHNIYDAKKFLDVASYKNVARWATEIEARPGVERGRRVNRTWGPEETRVIERHDASDFDITAPDPQGVGGLISFLFVPAVQESEERRIYPHTIHAQIPTVILKGMNNLCGFTLQDSQCRFMVVR